MLARLRAIGSILKRELAVYRLVLKHPRPPRVAKWLLGLAVAYVLMPFDLIPDFIPILGQLDDVIIVPALVWGALRLIPPGVVDECRRSVGAHNGHRR
jgi:uncharacterized membrane protein YkvA (DUF1232 family)